MNSSPERNHDFLSSIAAARHAWLDAMRSSDIDRLAATVTDDIVVIHGNGRCVRGKDELRADFLKAFRSFAIDTETVGDCPSTRKYGQDGLFTGDFTGRVFSLKLDAQRSLKPH